MVQLGQLLLPPARLLRQWGCHWLCSPNSVVQAAPNHIKQPKAARPTPDPSFLPTCCRSAVTRPSRAAAALRALGSTWRGSSASSSGRLPPPCLCASSFQANCCWSAASACASGHERRHGAPGCQSKGGIRKASWQQVSRAAACTVAWSLPLRCSAKPAGVAQTTAPTDLPPHLAGAAPPPAAPAAPAGGQPAPPPRPAKAGRQAGRLWVEGGRAGAQRSTAAAEAVNWAPAT